MIRFLVPRTKSRNLGCKLANMKTTLGALIEKKNKHDLNTKNNWRINF